MPKGSLEIVVAVALVVLASGSASAQVAGPRERESWGYGLAGIGKASWDPDSATLQVALGGERLWIGGLGLNGDVAEVYLGCPFCVELSASLVYHLWHGPDRAWSPFVLGGRWILPGWDDDSGSVYGIGLMRFRTQRTGVRFEARLLSSTRRGRRPELRMGVVF
jgi:hypothetical protein